LSNKVSQAGLVNPRPYWRITRITSYKTLSIIRLGYLEPWSQKDARDDHGEQEEDGVHDPGIDQFDFKPGINVFNSNYIKPT
jgi:hypothetical protein